MRHTKKKQIAEVFDILGCAQAHPLCKHMALNDTAQDFSTASSKMSWKNDSIIVGKPIITKVMLSIQYTNINIILIQKMLPNSLQTAWEPS